MNHFKDKNIFITGGTGFFGKSILSMLKRGFLSNTRFTILSRNPGNFRVQFPEFKEMKTVGFISGDVRNFKFPQVHFDYIIHAATPAITTLKPGEIRDIILNGNENIIRFGKYCGVEKILFTSSGAVYGVQPPELKRISENFLCRPNTEYGIAKLEAEQMCIASGISTKIARCFTFIGPYLKRDIQFAIGNFICSALGNKPIVINGDGTPLRSYLYADDLVEWLFVILGRGQKNIPYNVGSDEIVSILELAKTVKKVLNSKSSIEIKNAPTPKALPSRYIPNVNRAINTLQLKKKYDLESGIINTVKQ